MALSNREIKYLKSLNQKKQRLAEGRFLVEGVRLLEEALKSDYLPLTVFNSPDQLSERGKLLVKSFSERGTEVREISTSESSRLAGTRSSPGIIAIFGFRDFDLGQQLSLKPRKILVCDGINDPGNMGTLMRSAAAFDFDLVVTTIGSAEITNPKTIRAGMGAYFKIASIEGIAPELLNESLKSEGYRVFCADIKGESPEQKSLPSSGLALVIGSEASGLSPVFENDSHFRLRVAMSDDTESLNAAVAGSILMYRFYRNSGVQ